jgi:hypothetical protein
MPVDAHAQQIAARVAVEIDEVRLHRRGRAARTLDRERVSPRRDRERRADRRRPRAQRSRALTRASARRARPRRSRARARARVELALGDAFRELARRQVGRLVGEIERAPVHREHRCRAEIEIGLHRLARIHVLPAHEPARLVGADRQQRHVDRAEAPAVLGEALEVAGVAREEITAARPNRSAKRTTSDWLCRSEPPRPVLRRQAR